jgi:hypothetical protein
MHKLHLDRFVKRLKQTEKCKVMGDQYRTLTEAHAGFRDDFEKNKKIKANRPALYASGNALLPEIEKFRWNLPGYFEKKLGAGPCEIRNDEANAWFANLLENEAVQFKKLSLPWQMMKKSSDYFEKNIDSAFLIRQLKEGVIKFDSKPIYKYFRENGKTSVTEKFFKPGVFGAIVSGRMRIKEEPLLHPGVIVRIEIHATFDRSGTQTIAIIQPQIYSEY